MTNEPNNGTGVEDIKLDVQSHAAVVTLNRADQRNALRRKTIDQLSQVLENIRLDKGVRAVILTGAGSVFCAGMDLKEMEAAADADNAHDLWHEDALIFHDLLLQMLRFPKPLIAAVNGPALAGGTGLFLGCDLVVASETAFVSLPEPLRGIVAAMVTPLLAFRIGAGQSARLLLTADRFDAMESHRIGLFHEVTPPDQLVARAAEIAASCAKCAPEALMLTKKMLNETVGEHLTTLLGAAAAVSASARTTEAAAEGLAAFREKRAPDWK
ncbi:MAG: enoyl-CoA hydratase/isomerase family protein [Pirellulales bacterium]|nr:enoyl-CoA hydratase/isomerase family protein [Pirellulales bacterium]